MTPEAMAALHRRCFGDAPRPWSAEEFADMLARPEVFAASEAGTGFAVGRAAAGEAELLTLAVAPEARRAGLGRRLLAAFEREARARGAETAFLEVAEGNAPAAALYAAAGYACAGRRKDYYGPAGRRLSAMVLRKAL
jgi:ribosomal-protein-alanine N-acetyltransferase